MLECVPRAIRRRSGAAMSIGAPARLPEARNRAARGAPRRCEVSVALEVVTPILGGGTQTRAPDEIDIIRPATVRGHLRFWWRALHGHAYSSATDLHAAESAVWGQAATDDGGRSAVELRVAVACEGALDATDIDPQRTPGAYALWPARSEKQQGRPPAPRRLAGTRFRLTLLAPAHQEHSLRNVVRAWILFGGYGGRTRRGLGSLTTPDPGWLPGAATREALTQVFGRDVLALDEKAGPRDVPTLAGASLHVGRSTEAHQAWTGALEALKEFRQGVSGGAGDRAREPGTGRAQPLRASISNWPEADKVRRLWGGRSSHPPRHNEVPAWPRAGFGLPIVGRFQTKGRDGGTLHEPGAFELRWRAGGEEHERLASPLIVKALPLAKGQFVPCALWLARAHPKGEVVLRGAAKSAAPFDRLVAAGDRPHFSALADQPTLREAFLDWLHARRGTTVVAQ